MTYGVKLLSRDDDHQWVEDIELSPMVHVLSPIIPLLNRGFNIFSRLGVNGLGMNRLITET